MYCTRQPTSFLRPAPLQSIHPCLHSYLPTHWLVEPIRLEQHHFYSNIKPSLVETHFATEARARSPLSNETVSLSVYKHKLYSSLPRLKYQVDFTQCDHTLPPAQLNTNFASHPFLSFFLLSLPKLNIVWLTQPPPPPPPITYYFPVLRFTSDLLLTLHISSFIDISSSPPYPLSHYSIFSPHSSALIYPTFCFASTQYLSVLHHPPPNKPAYVPDLSRDIIISLPYLSTICIHTCQPICQQRTLCSKRPPPSSNHTPRPQKVKQGNPPTGKRNLDLHFLTAGASHHCNNPSSSI